MVKKTFVRMCVMRNDATDEREREWDGAVGDGGVTRAAVEAAEAEPVEAEDEDAEPGFGGTSKDGKTTEAVSCLCFTTQLLSNEPER
ncbi:hypothetical protein FACS189472_11970 [Alphaproteobacteria bacterium]|nr:hypothetical protein FACS189472_11970 [Alphaproteobacteria bacterium]